MIERPAILPVIERYVSLRKRGREFVGLCLFHSEKSPSFSVNADKGLFFCHGCQTGGDVFKFVMRAEKISFREASQRLGVASACKPRIKLTASRMQAAELAAAWVNLQRQKFNTLIADALENRDLADEIGNFELAESFDRQLVTLHAFHDALGFPRGAAEMLAVRPSIEKITDSVGVWL